MKSLLSQLLTAFLILHTIEMNAMHKEYNRSKPWTFKVSKDKNQIIATANKPDEEDLYGPAEVKVIKNLENNSFSISSEQLLRYICYGERRTYGEEITRTETHADAIEANYPNILDLLKKQIAVFEQQSQELKQHYEKDIVKN